MNAKFTLLFMGMTLGSFATSAQAALQVRLNQTGATVIYYGEGQNVVIRTCADYSPWFTQISECVSTSELKIPIDDFKKYVNEEIKSLPPEASAPFTAAELKNYQFISSSISEPDLSAAIAKDSNGLKGIEGYLMDDPKNQTLKDKKDSYLSSLAIENTEKKNRELQRSTQNTINSKIEAIIQGQILSEKISNLSYITNNGEMFFEALKQLGPRFQRTALIKGLVGLWASENGAVSIRIDSDLKVQGGGGWAGTDSLSELDGINGILKINFGGGAYVKIAGSDKNKLYFWDRQSGSDFKNLALSGTSPRITFIKY